VIKYNDEEMSILTLQKSLGTIVGCMRKLQRWNLTSIFEEYRRYAGPKVRLLNEQFIELFDTDLVGIPTNKPKWM
jgi:tyrosine-protein phosphatase OCA1